MMPTFDFGNILRKLVGGAVTALASPYAAALAGALAMDAIFVSLVGNVKIPSWNAPTAVSFQSDLLQVMLYCVNYDLIANAIRYICDFGASVCELLIHTVLALGGAVVGWGVYRVVRAQIKDFMAG